jgi:ribosomal protein S18 acetylase RimI-like enzyme
MKNYTLRPATNDDYDFLYHLIEFCLKEYIEATWGWDDDFQQSRFAEHFKITGCQTVLVNGGNAGQITTRKQDDSDFIAAIYILPEFQNQGLGSVLIEEVMAKAAENGRPVTLQVLKANQPARRLYERLGFVVTAEKLTHYAMQWDPNDLILGENQCTSAY